MPRNKKTQPLAALPAEVIDSLPDLTPSQLAFVRGILSGLTASEAYRRAYDTGNWTDEAIWVEASKQRRHPKVLQWLREARIMGLDSAKVTEEGHLGELASLREEARATGNIGAAVLAETNRGKVAGLYTERIDVSGAPLNGEQLLSSLAKLSPDAAAALAKDLGLPWPDGAVQ